MKCKSIDCDVFIVTVESDDLETCVMNLSRIIYSTGRLYKKRYILIY